MKAARRASTILFWLATILLLVVVICGCCSFHANRGGLTYYGCDAWKGKMLDAFSSIFLVQGFVNIGYSHIVSARNTRLYGIQLSGVIHDCFPLHSWAYVVHVLLVAVGICSSKLGLFCAASLSMVGFAMISVSIGLVMLVFVSRRKYTEKMLCSYFADVQKTACKTRYVESINESERESSTKGQILQGAIFYRHYFLATHQLPRDAFDFATLFESLPFELMSDTETATFGAKHASADICRYCYGSRSSGCLDSSFIATIETVIYARVFVENLMEGLNNHSRIELIRMLLTDMASSIEKCSLPMQKIDENPKYSDINGVCVISERIKSVHILICGILSYLLMDAIDLRIPGNDRHSGNPRTDKSRRDLENDMIRAGINWYQVFQTLAAVNSFASSSGTPSSFSRSSLGFENALIREIFLLGEAAAFVMQVETEQDELPIETAFHEMLELVKKVHQLGNKSIVHMYAVGQILLQSSGTPEYNPERTMIKGSTTLDWLRMVWK